MKLRNKLVIAQLCVFLVIMGILLMALPELVYRNISVKDREDTMILNEQIMSQLDPVSYTHLTLPTILRV